MPAMRNGLGPHRTLSLCLWLIGCALLASACEATALPVVPTDLPTPTASFTPSPTRTPGGEPSMTPLPTQVAASGGPTATPLFGATRTPLPANFPTATRIFNPNAPRIDFFTSDPLSVEPGAAVTLFWSARNVNTAVIYRLDVEGQRSEVFNVAPDGSLAVTTARSDRGELRFELVAGEGANAAEARITIPLRCPVAWFFSPAPEDCPTDNPLETRVVDQTMERGRMVFVEANNVVYVLFNDGQQPAWLSFENEYDPQVHRERDPNAPPEFIQPLAELGFVWRNDERIRSRLGLGLVEATAFDGFLQTQPAGRQEMIYISGANGVVLQLMPGNELWQIIGAPQ